MKIKSPLLRKTIKHSPLPLAFLIPFLGVLAVLLVKQCEPFGNSYALLYSDEYHQYYPFFLEFRKALLRGDSLLYSWNVGMGMDYLGLISYYLASPLNLLSVFVPEGLVLEYFALLAPIKLGLAGLFFAIFLKKIFGKNDISIALFGSLYALCAWAMGYLWNIMWLDTFALLPLVALGTISLLKDKKYILYTITLFLSIFANYYVGFFTCIFVLLLFICYQICHCTGFKELAKDFVRIGLFTVIAIGMTAILELPALAALQDTFSSNNSFPTGFDLNIVSTDKLVTAQNAWSAFSNAKASDAGLFAIVGKWFIALGKSFLVLLQGMTEVAGNMSGELSATRMEGLPNIACGVCATFMAFLFLTARGVKLREKLCCAGLLLFFMLSFIIRQLDYIWHGFHFTNMIPYRFSFLFSFVILYMAYRTWLLRDSFGPWQITIAFALSGMVTIFSDKANDIIFIAYNVAFLLMYVVIFMLTIAQKLFSKVDEETPDEEQMLRETKRRLLFRRIKAISLCALMSLEIVLILVKFGLAFPRTAIANYPEGTHYSASMFRYIQEREARSDFSRVEVTEAQTLNDGALNGYYGVSTFTSSANVRVTDLFQAIGLASYGPYNRYCYEQTSPVVNLFLNLKYLVDRSGNPINDPYFDRIHSYGNVGLMQNNAYLPLGFLAESSLSRVTLDSLTKKEDGSKQDNEFYKQNLLFSQATGLDRDVWTMYSGHNANITAYNDVRIDKKIKNNETAYISYHTELQGGRLEYSYVMDTDGYLCLELNMSEENPYSVSVNGREMYRRNLSLPCVVSVGQIKAGDEVKVAVYCEGDIPASDPGVVNIRAALLNDEVFRQGHEILSASTLDLTEFSNTLVQGTINCNRDGLLYTSIPFNGNWIAEVDGKEAEIVLVGDAMMALELTEGTHTITFRYKNSAFTLGAVISALSLTAFAVIIVVPIILKKRKKNTAEKE